MRSNVINLDAARDAAATARRRAVHEHPSAARAVQNSALQNSARHTSLHSANRHISALTNASLSNSANLSKATTPDTDVELVVSLLRSVSDGSGELTRLTGIGFEDGREPDFLAVRTGATVDSALDGGLTRIGWTDATGSTITWFADGATPFAYHGVAVTFGATCSNEQRSELRRTALDGLAQRTATSRFGTISPAQHAGSDSDAIA